MTETLVQWFVENLGGSAAKELVIFIISMIPILELRGGLLAAGPAFLDVEMWRAIPICIVGNLIPVPFILLFITAIFNWLKKTKLFRPMVEKLENRAMNKKDQIEKYEFWGLLLFVGIPQSSPLIKSSVPLFTEGNIHLCRILLFKQKLNLGWYRIKWS